MNRATPRSHPFISRIFHEINHPLIKINAPGLETSIYGSYSEPTGLPSSASPTQRSAAAVFSGRWANKMLRATWPRRGRQGILGFLPCGFLEK